jgi:hypothetical protein
LRRTIPVLAVLLIVSAAIGLVAAQAPDPISLGFASTLPLIIGQTSIITVTVTNIVNSTVELSFLGVRFEWDRPPSWFVGGGSDSGAVLSTGQQINYNIPVAIPSNVTAGTHRLTTYVTYRLFKDGNWTGLIAAFWVTDFPFAYPAQTQTAQVGPLQMSSIETIAALVLVVGIALFLERGHIRRLTREFRKTTPEQPTPAEIKKPTAKEREEQEV